MTSVLLMMWAVLALVALGVLVVAVVLLVRWSRRQRWSPEQAMAVAQQHQPPGYQTSPPPTPDQFQRTADSPFASPPAPGSAQGTGEPQAQGGHVPPGDQVPPPPR